MLYDEFLKLTGGLASVQEYEEINKLYSQSDRMTKQTAAQLWKLRYGAGRSITPAGLHHSAESIMVASFVGANPGIANVIHKGMMEADLAKSKLYPDKLTGHSYTLVEMPDGYFELCVVDEVPMKRFPEMVVVKCGRKMSPGTVQWPRFSAVQFI